MSALRRQGLSANTLLASAAAIGLLLLFDQSKPAPMTPIGAALQVSHAAQPNGQPLGWSAAPAVLSIPLHRSNSNQSYADRAVETPKKLQPLSPVPMDRKLHSSLGRVPLFWEGRPTSW